MKHHYSNSQSNRSRKRSAMLAIAFGLIAASAPLHASDSSSAQLYGRGAYGIVLEGTNPNSTGDDLWFWTPPEDADGRPAGGGGGDDIIVFDIIDSLAPSDQPAEGGGGYGIMLFDTTHSMNTTRPAGGGGGDDIIVFDIIDSAVDSSRPAGGGGADIIVFDIIDSIASSGRAAGGGGGGDIIVFDIIDSVAASSRPAGGGGDGGDIIVFDIIDSVTSARTSLKPSEPAQARSESPLPVLMVIANQDFYYSEYAETRRSIESMGVRVRVAAASTAPAIPHANSGQPAGSTGIVTPDLALSRADANDYSAIVFVGGWGSSMYQYAYNDPDLDGRIDNYYQNTPYNADTNLRDRKTSRNQEAVNELINDFVAQDKYVAGLCHGVTVLAWARVDGVSPLDGRTVSVPFIGSPATFYLGNWYADYQLGQWEQVVLNGAFPNNASGAYGDPATAADDVIVDGKIITAENYDSAPLFGLVVAKSVLAAAVR